MQQNLIPSTVLRSVLRKQTILFWLVFPKSLRFLAKYGTNVPEANPGPKKPAAPRFGRGPPAYIREMAALRTLGAPDPPSLFWEAAFLTVGSEALRVPGLATHEVRPIRPDLKGFCIKAGTTGTSLHEYMYLSPWGKVSPPQSPALFLEAPGRDCPAPTSPPQMGRGGVGLVGADVGVTGTTQQRAGDWGGGSLPHGMNECKMPGLQAYSDSF